MSYKYFDVTYGTTEATNVVTTDSSGNVTMPDGDRIAWGTGGDMYAYHDDSNGYLINTKGALKLATENSGIAVTIGHTTSEVTIADNLTVVGDLTVTGTTTTVDVEVVNTANGVIFEGATDDGYETTLKAVDPASSDKSIQLPNLSGYVALLDAATTTAISSTPAELNLLDGLDRGSILYGNTSSVTTVLGQGTANQVLTSDGTDISWADAQGGTATAVTIADESSDTTCFPLFATAATGDLGPKSGSNLTFNSSSGLLTATQLAGTLQTAAQANVTSLGTLTALTVDDVAVDGKVITMTGSSSDTAVITAGTNGTLSIVTTDSAAAAANIQITADGTAELEGTTVTLDSSGGITLDADGGTITFADAGSSLGTITSSGYSGTAAVATAVTITDNESTNETNAIIFTAGGDVDGGDIGLESDGDLTYNPSTGKVSATIVAGSTSLQTALIEYTDGDDAITIADGGACTFAQPATFSAGVTHNVTSTSANLTLTDSHYYVIVTAERTITLPAAVAGNVGLTYIVKNKAGATVTITPDTSGSADSIDGATGSITLNNDKESVTLFVGAADNWYVA